jgi:hypothetical protein
MDGNKTFREEKGRRDESSINEGSGSRLGSNGMVRISAKKALRHSGYISREESRKVDMGDIARATRSGRLGDDFDSTDCGSIALAVVMPAKLLTIAVMDFDKLPYRFRRRRYVVISLHIPGPDEPSIRVTVAVERRRPRTFRCGMIYDDLK